MTRLLLVDDDDSNRLTLSALLEDEGWLVDGVASFSEAKSMLEASPPAYAAVLLDHSLGDGFGSDLIPLIRRSLPSSKVVAMSGSVGGDRKSEEFDAELPKGMHFPDFLRRLRVLLGSP
ncbi:MAG TPA: response regulator [Polyangiaceae bacterium]|nr:response regulator [Polyangiaceae bacterium]